MLLDEIKRKVDATIGGIECFKLGDVVQAYAQDRGLPWEKTSRPRVDGLRAELARAGYVLWPEVLEDHQATRHVYVISPRGLVTAVRQVLSGEIEPNPIVCDSLNRVLGGSVTRASA
ncbi:hypothetical protein [Actinomadura sp. 3N508]|uniref:hypothetical protein n=1 Tax=Actinomadura sp. 3N508 TaxID=3375153 RepID=UPI00379B98F0